MPMYPQIRGSWGLSRCFIRCRLAWSDAFIGICSCRPSITTTACERRPVSERLQLKAKVVFVRWCQMQSKTGFALSSALPPSKPLSLVLCLYHSNVSSLHWQFHATYFMWSRPVFLFAFTLSQVLNIGVCREHIYLCLTWIKLGRKGNELAPNIPAVTSCNGFRLLWKSIIDRTGLKKNTYKPNYSTDVPNWCLSH